MRTAFPLLLWLTAGPAAAADVYTLSAARVEAYDFVELTARLPAAPPGNPFAVACTGTAQSDAEVPGASGPKIPLTGFCDDPAGRVYRLRFMPAAAGTYLVTARFPGRPDVPAFRGFVTAGTSRRKGLVAVDPSHPFHFLWAGTGDHFFYNGATAYWLLGHADDAAIFAAVDRLAANKVTRVRVALNARTTGGDRWFEPKIQNTDGFRFNVMPWVAGDPADPKNPKFDTARYNVELWRKCERMLAHAREKDVAVSVIFHLDGQDPGVDPFGGGKAYPGSDAEKNYYRYAAARLGAFSNVMWDVTNEWHLFRDEKWVTDTAQVLSAADPYGHLTTVHGKDTFPFRAEPWADYCIYQCWDDAGGYAYMRRMRAEQLKAGPAKPQVNEEYGYEDHYPGKWGGNKKPPARNADSRRKLAWEMTMAGGYQTTGERADTGAGGWLTGRGDAAMTLAKLHGHMAAFFTSFDWWKCDPADGLAAADVRVLAEPGRVYAVYAPRGGAVTVTLPAGDYTAAGYDPATGAWAAETRVRSAGGAAVEHKFAHAGDGAVVFRRVR